MSNLNLNILVQSVEGLAQQLEKSNANLQQDRTALVKAQALLEGLKGMYGIDTIIMDSSDMINIDLGINGFTTKMILDPVQSLKLTSIKVFDQSMEAIEVDDILSVCSVLQQPNDIRQAIFLVSDRIANMQ